MPPLSVRERKSPNRGGRRGAHGIDILLLHYTGMETAQAAIDRLCDPVAGVSAHYVIEEDGTIWRLVDENARAWHAGEAFWDGESDINSRSIGIELVNPGHGPDYRPFPEAQMIALEQLAAEIVARHAIPASRVLAHSDVAPGRKQDPGELFDWRRLARSGIGLWSEAQAGEAAGDVEMLMRRFGYAGASPDAIAAFQRHFRPDAVTGEADAETVARLADLVSRAGLA